MERFTPLYPIAYAILNGLQRLEGIRLLVARNFFVIKAEITLSEISDRKQAQMTSSLVILRKTVWYSSLSVTNSLPLNFAHAVCCNKLLACTDAPTSCCRETVALVARHFPQSKITSRHYGTRILKLWRIADMICVLIWLGACQLQYIIFTGFIVEKGWTNKGEKERRWQMDKNVIIWIVNQRIVNKVQNNSLICNRQIWGCLHQWLRAIWVNNQPISSPNSVWLHVFTFDRIESESFLNPHRLGS